MLDARFHHDHCYPALFSDRADCARSAAGQSGYEPAPAGNGTDPARQDAYRRAEGACLEGRGYTVR